MVKKTEDYLSDFKPLKPREIEDMSKELNNVLNVLDEYEVIYSQKQELEKQLTNLRDKINCKGENSIKFDLAYGNVFRAKETAKQNLLTNQNL